MRTACRKDRNHTAIAEVFSQFGFTVIDTSAFSGRMLDILVYIGDYHFQFIEIKDGSKPPSARKLTTDEVEFMQTHHGHCTVIESEEQAKNYCAYVIAGKHF